MCFWHCMRANLVQLVHLVVVWQKTFCSLFHALSAVFWDFQLFPFQSPPAAQDYRVWVMEFCIRATEAGWIRLACHIWKNTRIFTGWWKFALVMHTSMGSLVVGGGVGPQHDVFKPLTVYVACWVLASTKFMTLLCELQIFLYIFMPPRRL